MFKSKVTGGVSGGLATTLLITHTAAAMQKPHRAEICHILFYYVFIFKLEPELESSDSEPSLLQAELLLPSPACSALWSSQKELL